MKKNKQYRKMIAFFSVLVLSLFFSNDIIKKPGPQELPAQTDNNIEATVQEEEETSTETVVEKKKEDDPFDFPTKPIRFYGIEQETNIASGVTYKKYIFKTGGSRHIAHVLEADISDPDYKVEILKAFDNTSKVQKLHNMINHYDSTNDHMILGGVNASFWRSYSNQPMGPTIINGEVAELYSFNTWSSAFFDTEGKMHIDRFHTKCTVTKQNGKEFNVDLVNRRENPTGVVLYNSYVGNRVPYISDVSVREAFKKAMKEERYRDISEEKFDTLKFKRELRRQQRLSSYDYRAPKVILRYLDSPAMNKEIKCVVTASNRRGTVPVPADGCVLTFGRDINRKTMPKIGDTLSLAYSTDIKDSVRFMNALCGTPRLVRNGRAKAEIEEENLRSKRFVQGALRRTAIGTGKDKNIVYFVTVEGSRKNSNIRGADLKQLSYIMRKVGAYDAINLDGGGSSVMVVNDNNVMNKNCLNCSRSLAVGIGIARKKITLASLFDNFT
eukprot:Anaeramoba_ignava/a96591_73.p1 GENE.a96591_73~~a96591_73.p1  ORF type:complete len:498 (-),score=-8.74 a96591_73:114-1607(-)